MAIMECQNIHTLDNVSWAFANVLSYLILTVAITA